MRGSLKNKVIFIIVISALILSGATIIASSRIVTGIIDSSFKERAQSIAATVAVTIDAEAAGRVTDDILAVYDSAENRVKSDEWGSDAFNEYTGLFSDITKTEDFAKVKEELTAIQDVNSVECIYTIYLNAETEDFIYLVDADPEEPCPPGCIDPLYDINRPTLKDPDRGFPAYITNTEEYGWLVTAGAPVYDRSGRLVCYACTDISMNDMVAYQRRMVMLLILLELALTAVIAFLVISRVRRSVLAPVKELTDAASNYYKDESPLRSSFSSIDIRTGDEIESLSESMKQMERDINDNIANILALTNQLDESRSEAVHLSELAKKDALTGVRNKLAYDEEIRRVEEDIEKGDTGFGLILFDLDDLKRSNDTYGHDKGDIAIRQLSSVICSVFEHSPVFRIGGDEFAAVLRGRDYENIEALYDEFCREIDRISTDSGLRPWEGISASAGYALYDKTKDDGVESVFRRADTEMYRAKKLRKARKPV